MTHGTVLRRWNGNMVLRHALRRSTVVTGATVIHDAIMIEYRRSKGTAGYMADIAILGGHHVGRVGLCILAGSIGPIMTGIAPSTSNVRPIVVNECIGKIRRVVAHRAVSAGVLVDGRIRFPEGSDRNIICTAIMAGGTISGDTHM